MFSHHFPGSAACGASRILSIPSSHYWCYLTPTTIAYIIVIYKMQYPLFCMLFPPILLTEHANIVKSVNIKSALSYFIVMLLAVFKSYLFVLKQYPLHGSMIVFAK